MTDDDELPIACHHKGVAIFANQPTKRILLVKAEIDEIGEISDLERLFEICGDCSWSPEGRILAGARCLAGLQLATERRQLRPDFDREDVEARTAGLGVRRWAHPERYCSLLDVRDENAGPRETPLAEAE